MIEEKQQPSFFEKNKSFIIGFALVVIIGALVVLVNLQRTRTEAPPAGEGFNPEANGVDMAQDTALFLPKEKFKNKSGTEIQLATVAECQNCDAPEFLLVQRTSDNKDNRIPSPQEHNSSDPGSAHLRMAVIYGACSDDVVVYGEATLPMGMDEDLSESADAPKGPPPPEGTPANVSYSKWVTSVPASGEITIHTEALTKDEFAQAWAGAPAGCKTFHQEGPLVVGD